MEKLDDDLYLTREMFKTASRSENLNNVHARETFAGYIERFLLKNELVSSEKLARKISNEFIDFFEQEESELKNIELQATIAVPEYNNHAGAAPAIIY